MSDTADKQAKRQRAPFLRKALRAVGLALAALGLNFAVSLVAATTPPQDYSRIPFHSFDFSYVVKIAPPTGSRKLEVWIPLPSTDELQSISHLELSGAKRIRIVTDRKNGNRHAFVTLDPAQIKAPIEIRVAFQATRYEYRLDRDPTCKSRDKFSRTVASFLQTDMVEPIDTDVARLAREQTADMSDPLQKARRLYDYLIASAHTDRDALFVAMARAVGIPARLQVGFSLLDDQKEGSLAGSHVWAEFYVNGTGWIPVDASEAMREPFGQMDANRVVFSTGLNRSEPFASKAASLKESLFPYVQVDGSPYARYSADVFFHEDGLPNATPSKKTIFAFGGVADVNPLPRQS